MRAHEFALVNKKLNEFAPGDGSDRGMDWTQLVNYLRRTLDSFGFSFEGSQNFAEYSRGNEALTIEYDPSDPDWFGWALGRYAGDFDVLYSGTDPITLGSAEQVLEYVNEVFGSRPKDVSEGFNRFQVGDKISFPLSQMATGIVAKIDDKRLYVKLDNGEVYTIPSTMLHSVKLLERQGVAEGTENLVAVIDGIRSNRTYNDRDHAHNSLSKLVSYGKAKVAELYVNGEKVEHFEIGKKYREFEPKSLDSMSEAGPFSYGAKKPRKGSVADLAAKKRQKQERGKQPVEPKDHMVGVARVTKGISESTDKIKTVRGPHGNLSVDRSQKGVTRVSRQGFRTQEPEREVGARGRPVGSTGYTPGVGVAQRGSFSDVYSDYMARRKRPHFDYDDDEFREAEGDPKNPSRRGFLKALGAAGVAAAMPGVAAKALSTPAAAAAAEVPAAAASSTIMADLFQAALMHGADSDWKDQENDWDDDAPEGSWNEEFDDFQGKEGTTPWGEIYEVQTSPSGNLFLYTGSPYGESGVLTYKKNGKTHTLELDWDTTIGGLDSVLYASDDADEEIYNNYLEKHGRIDEADLGKLIDAIIAGPSAGNAPGKSRKEREEEEMERWWEEYNQTHQPYRVYNKHTGEIEKVINATDDQDAIEQLVNYKGQYWQYDPAKHEMFSAQEHLHGPHVGGQRPPERKIDIPGVGTTPADIARLAGLAQRGYDAAMSAGEPKEPPATEPQKPQALPAPQKPDIDLTPDLKQKQQEPVKHKKDES